MSNCTITDKRGPYDTTRSQQQEYPLTPILRSTLYRTLRNRMSMAPTDRGDRNTISTYDGMEVDLSATGLQKRPDSQGIELIPREVQSATAPQAKAGLEHVFTHEIPGTALLRLIDSSDPKIPAQSYSSRKSKRYLPLFIAAIIVVVVVVALAIPLALELKKHSKSYA